MTGDSLFRQRNLQSCDVGLSVTPNTAPCDKPSDKNVGRESRF
jgi:hypothetical protein